MRPQLTFTCPEKWSSMSPQEGGRHCASCNIVVRDFSELSKDEILREINNATGEHTCGSFKAYQLEAPFADKRNVLIRFYQRVAAMPARKSLVRSLQLGLAVVLLLISGCHRRLSGAYATPSKKQLRQLRKTEQMKQEAAKKPVLRMRKVRENW